MSKSTIVLFSAVLFGVLPALSTAHAEGEQQQAPVTQEPQIPDTQDGAPQTQDPAVNDSDGQAPQVQQPSVSNPDGETSLAPSESTPQGPKNYDKTSFFADFKHFQIGDIVPDSYRAPHYNIKEWQKRHLTAPEPGSHWTYMGGDYVLITDNEGKILKVLSGDIIYQ